MHNSTYSSGRSSSQISIYDYPEHLNPFYEDENHKRLRFWKINSKKNNGKPGRSNSFSLSGIKDIWAFKPFTLKKRSSTLGINKTSESPPILRRQIYPDAYDTTYNNTNTFDSRLRHTVDVGLGDSFQRNAPYRSSLQDVTPQKSEIGLYRNDRYRSTIQNGFNTVAGPHHSTNRYIYAGSITPIPNQRYLTPASASASAASTITMKHGTSQSSLNSTNPFDDIDDDMISQAESIDSMSPIRRSRKKRRAPLPPMATSTPTKVDIHSEVIKENSLEETADLREITQLTSEIESFVKTADTDCELRITEDSIADRGNSTPASTSTNAKNCEKSKSNDSSSASSASNKIDRIDDIHPVARRKLLLEINSRESPENNEDYPERMSQSPEKESNDRLLLLKTNSEKQLNIVEHIQQSQRSSPTPQIVLDLVNDSPEPIETATNHGRTDIVSTTSQMHVLPERPETSEQCEKLEICEETTDDCPIPPPRSSELYKIRFIALKNSPQPIRRDIDGTMQPVDPTKSFTSTSTSTSSSKSDKRRTVKDIIASINKSQSLLRINRDKYKRNDASTNTLPFKKNTVEQPDVQYTEKALSEMIAEMDDIDLNHSPIPVTVEHFDKLNNNYHYQTTSDNMFKKCNSQQLHNSSNNNNSNNNNGTTYNNSEYRSSSLEWNPVPKPRRSKPMTNQSNETEIKIQKEK